MAKKHQEIDLDRALVRVEDGSSKLTTTFLAVSAFLLAGTKLLKSAKGLVSTAADI